MIKQIVKKLIYGYKADSKSMVKYLNDKGANIDESVYIVVPTKTTVDVTRPYLLDIRANVTITEGVQILTHGFDWSVLKIAYGDVIGSAGKVTIKENCFIGVNSIILKGCTIGENTIIGAGSVVCSDIPANCVAAGNPCKVICSLQEYYEKRKIMELQEAKELIENYYRKFLKKPPLEEVAEFLGLFGYNEDEVPNVLLRKMKYGGERCYEQYLENRKKNPPLFKSYDELCKTVIDE